MDTIHRSKMKSRSYHEGKRRISQTAQHNRSMAALTSTSTTTSTSTSTLTSMSETTFTLNTFGEGAAYITDTAPNHLLFLDSHALYLAERGLDKTDFRVNSSFDKKNSRITQTPNSEQCELHIYCVTPFEIARPSSPKWIGNQFDHMQMCGKVIGDIFFPPFLKSESFELKDVRMHPEKITSDVQDADIAIADEISIVLDPASPAHSISLHYAEFSAIEEGRRNLIVDCETKNSSFRNHSQNSETQIDSPPISSIVHSTQTPQHYEKGTPLAKPFDRSFSSSYPTRAHSKMAPQRRTHQVELRMKSQHRADPKKKSTSKNLPMVELASLPLYAMHCPREGCRRRLKRLSPPGSRSKDGERERKHFLCKHLEQSKRSNLATMSRIQRAMGEEESDFTYSTFNSRLDSQETVFSALFNAISLCWADGAAFSPMASSKSNSANFTTKRDKGEEGEEDMSLHISHEIESDGYCGESDEEKQQSINRFDTFTFSQEMRDMTSQTNAELTFSSTKIANQST